MKKENSATSFCFVLKPAEEGTSLEKIVDRIVDEYKIARNDLCVLCDRNNDVESNGDVCADLHPSSLTPRHNLSEFCIRLCDNLCLFPSLSTTFVGGDDSLIIIQLCMAERRKKECGIFDADVSDVFLAEMQLTGMRLNPDWATGSAESDQLFYRDLLTDYESYLQHIGAVDLVQVYLLLDSYFKSGDQCTDEEDGVKLAFENLNFLLLDGPREGVEKLMLKLLTSNKRVLKIERADDCVELDLETTNSENSLLPAEFIDTTLDELSDESRTSAATPGATCTPSQHDRKQAHMERVIVSYLRLLINTRDEIALASALCNMVKGFTHEAFSELKRMSKASGLPMYQTSLSLVRRIKLGGKSYALDSASPIIPFLPDIIAFNALMGKMQRVIEEQADLRISIKTIVKVVKEHARKSCNQKLTKENWDSVASNIENLATDEILRTVWSGFSSTNLRAKFKTVAIVGQETLTTLRLFTNNYSIKSVFRNQADVLTESYSVENTTSPVRFPSLLSQFRSPEIDCKENDNPKPLKVGSKDKTVQKQNQLCDVSNNKVHRSPKTVEQPQIASTSRQSEISHYDSDTCCSLTATPTKEKQAVRMASGQNTKKPNNSAQETKENAKPGTKRTLDLNDDNSKGKAKKANTEGSLKKNVSRRLVAGTTRKKQMGIIKGQQLMTKFFRV